jgi:hypothetical protein
MLVKDLISELSKINPDQEIIFRGLIESGRSLSICGDGSCSLSLEEEEDFKDRVSREKGLYNWDEEHDIEKDLLEIDKLWEYTLPKVVFTIEGEETECQ